MDYETTRVSARANLLSSDGSSDSNKNKKSNEAGSESETLPARQTLEQQRVDRTQNQTGKLDSPFCVRDEVLIEAALFHPPGRIVVHHVFGVDASHFRIGHGEQPLHVLYSGKMGLDVEAIEPLQHLITALCLPGI